MKYVYAFHEGTKDMRNLLGGKGANLAEMTNIGLPVPRGFTVTTEACLKYYEDGEELNKDIIKEIYEQLEALEKRTGKTLGDPKKSTLGFCSKWSTCIYARNDGYSIKSWYE